MDAGDLVGLRAREGGGSWSVDWHREGSVRELIEMSKFAV